MRERVTITIKRDVLEQVDRLVDGSTIRSRSQAIEYLLGRLLLDFGIRNAIVLCGGKRKNLLLGKQARFLAEINGKSVLERALDSIHEFRVNSFFVSADSFRQEIMDGLSKKSLDYHVDFAPETHSSGTIEPLKLLKERLKETFLVAYGDTIASINLSDMLAFHKKNNAVATIALTTVNNPRKYGVVEMQGNKVVSFMEKPKKEIKSFLISAGYFLFEPEVFRHISSGMKNIETDLFPELAEKGVLFGYNFQGKYLNIHTHTDLERAKILV